MKNVIQHLETWMANLANNGLEPGSHSPAFDKPLVGFAAGDDGLFAFLQQDIGADFYWTPQEAFTLAYPGEKVSAEELTVICWILPQTRETRLAHRKAINLPSIQWSKARHFGEKVNENLRRTMVAYFENEGTQAFAPTLLPEWQRAISSQYGFASSWSERHTAHVCGLGTFGVSDGLITPVGKAVRIGSIIVRRKFPPTSRKYRHPNEWCLHHATGKCLVCVRRCPAGAIAAEGHDKAACKQYIRNITAPYVEKKQLGCRVNSCGLCQALVPCESRNPVTKTSK